MTGYSTGSCFGYQMEVSGAGFFIMRHFFHSAPAHFITFSGWGEGFFVMRQRITKKGGALRKNQHPKPPSGTRNPKQEPVLSPAS